MGLSMTVKSHQTMRMEPIYPLATPHPPSLSAMWLWVTRVPCCLPVSLKPDPTPIPSKGGQTELETSQMQTQIGPLIANPPSENSVS